MTEMKKHAHPSGSILMKKYGQYLLPSILTSLALALNEFVDCMVVSNLPENVILLQKMASHLLKEAEQFDDLTMLCMEYRGGQKSDE